VDHNDADPLPRLNTINHNLGELLQHVTDHHNRGQPTAGSLRIVGRELVSLAGDLTTLGVDIAHWADELDRTPNPPPPTDTTQ
jgi:hypothetical protein